MVCFAIALFVQFLVIHRDSWTTVFTMGDNHLRTPPYFCAHWYTSDDATPLIFVELFFNYFLLVMRYRDGTMYCVWYCVGMQMYMTHFVIQCWERWGLIKRTVPE